MDSIHNGTAGSCKLDTSFIPTGMKITQRKILYIILNAIAFNLFPHSQQKPQFPKRETEGSCGRDSSSIIMRKR